jgi:hypothetical protein
LEAFPEDFWADKWYGWKYYDVFYTMESSITANTFSKPLKN